MNATRSRSSRIVTLVLCAIAGFSLPLAMTGFTGCATFKEHSATVELAVTIATTQYIEKSPRAEWASKAAKVREIASKALETATAENLSIPALAATVVAQLPDTMPPGDRVLAIALVKLIQQELSLKLGDNVLKPDDIVTVRGVLQAVVAATGYYEE